MTPSTIRFLHTADLHLGRTSSRLDMADESRYVQARIDAVHRMADVAREQKCSFVVIAGDVFESDRVAGKILTASAAAFARFDVPVYIVPGNHEPLDKGSVYRRDKLIKRLPETVHIVDRIGPFTEVDGVEIWCAPWLRRHITANPIDETLQALIDRPREGAARVLVAHGAFEGLGTPDLSAEVIAREPVWQAVDSGAIDYVALGDRHVPTRCGREAVWFSGTPEPTDFDDVHSECGQVLVVTLTAPPPRESTSAPETSTIPGSRSSDEPAPEAWSAAVEPVTVGTWAWRALEVDFDEDSDVERFARQLDSLPGEHLKTVIKVAFHGKLSVAGKAELDALMNDRADDFASLRVRERTTDLVIVPSDLDVQAFRGYARLVAERLAEETRQYPENSEAADALVLLHTLAQQGDRS